MTTAPSRMLTLLSLLQTRQEWPGQVLAERLAVTPRTIRRDVDRLRELGYRIDAFKGPTGGYRLAAGSDLPPLLFDDEQAVAIAVALQHAPASGVEIAEAAARALATFRQLMPSRLRHRIDGVQFAAGSSATQVRPEVLQAVSDAVRGHQTLRFDYGGSDRPARRTEPHALVVRHGRWYLVAWDLERDDWRTYRLDRLTPRVPTGPVFTPREIPTGEPGTFLAARAKGSDREDRWPCIGTFEVSLPARDVAPWVSDGQVEAIGEGCSLVTTGSWSWTGLVAQMVRFDAPVRVVGPPELRTAADAVASRLATALRA